MIDRVTITGPDDSIRPEELLPLTERFPFVEWGILISASNSKTPRFPSNSWIANLLQLASEMPMNLSLHMCGRWVREMLMGKECPLSASITDWFQRIQLNFHAEKTPCDVDPFLDALNRLGIGHQYIFQIDGNGGNEHYVAARDRAAQIKRPCDLVPLFDISGGAGILPESWPAPTGPGYHGYAGGLGPHNLEEQIPLILKAAGTNRIWIDMETHVRSAYDRQFDLKRVERCLEIAKPFIQPSKEHT
jgi:hypothetical protein